MTILKCLTRQLRYFLTRLDHVRRNKSLTKFISFPCRLPSPKNIEYICTVYKYISFFFFLSDYMCYCYPSRAGLSHCGRQRYVIRPPTPHCPGPLSYSPQNRLFWWPTSFESQFVWLWRISILKGYFMYSGIL